MSMQILILFWPFLGTTAIGDTHGVGLSAFSITPSFSSLAINSSISFLTWKGTLRYLWAMGGIFSSMCRWTFFSLSLSRPLNRSALSSRSLRVGSGVCASELLMWLTEWVFADSSLSLLHVSQLIMGFSGFFIKCMSAWQEIPLNSRSVLNWPRTGVASWHRIQILRFLWVFKTKKN